MRYTRTITTVAWLFAATSITPIGADGPAPALPSVAASPAAGSIVEAPLVPVRHEPWYADYPATTEIDGATVYAADPALVDDVRWALGRFVAAGLALPPVEVWIHQTPSGCRGSDGREMAGYYRVNDGVDVVYSCGTRFTLLHELAHVWDNHSVSDDIRTAFLAERGLEVWGGAEWRLCGGEHLANVIAWGLHDEHPRPLSTAPNDDADLHRAFVLATGGIDPLW